MPRLRSSANLPAVSVTESENGAVSPRMCQCSPVFAAFHTSFSGHARLEGLVLLLYLITRAESYQRRVIGICPTPLLVLLHCPLVVRV